MHTVISLISFLSPKYEPIFSLGVSYDTSRLMFCSIKTIRGTIKRMFKNVIGLVEVYKEDINAKHFAHSRAISVFSVSVL